MPPAPISIPTDAPHIASSHEPTAAESAQITSSPVEAKKRSYENDGGFNWRKAKKVRTPKSAEASAFSSGR